LSRRDRPSPGKGPKPRAPRATAARRDRELEAGSLAHYEDPAYYAATYAQRLEDVAYYVGLAQRAGGPVLEYGAGNGRIALPIARHGIDVVGIDHSAPMLADLRARLAREPAEVRARVRAVRGDMRRVRLGRRFPLVLATFNTALHLYTRDDVERFLARVREHLAPRGRFVLDLVDELKAAGREVNLARLGEHTVAKTVCRHAVKANDPLGGPELENLVEDLRRCAMPYTCPHGRPTLIEMNYRELEKKFGRVQ